MLSNQGYIESQDLLNKKYDKLNANIQQNLQIERLIKNLDDNIVKFNVDLEEYNLLSVVIKNKISEYNENKKDYPRNVYVDRLSDGGITKKYIGCYKNEGDTNMDYVGNLSRKQCKEYAYNTQHKYFALNMIDGDQQCSVSNNLYDIIKDGERIKTTPLWQHNFETNNDINIDGGFAHPSGGYADNKDNQRYTRGWALSNGFKGNDEECKVLCNQQPECTNNKCISKLYATDERCYCKFSINLQLRILNTTFAVVNHNNKVIYSNDFVTANSELNQSENTENASVTPQEGFIGSFQWNNYRQTVNVPSNDIPVNPNKDRNIRLQLTDNGRLILKDMDQQRNTWKPSYMKQKSIVVNEWIPTNNPTNKYKRSYITTGEFLDAGESISSQNGKYKL